MAPLDNAVYIADGTAALFRAYFGMRPVSAPDGSPVGALLGMAQWLAKMVATTKPSHVALVFDAGAKTFRNQIFSDYKANRGEPPEDLVPQFDRARDMVRALGFVEFCEPGFEADDLIATLARKVRRSTRPCVLLTPDKDVLQLVDERNFAMDPKHFTVLDAAGVHTKFGVHPWQMIDYQALCGDSTDNIPGVPGIGPKSASALLETFESIDAMYEDLEAVAALKLRGAKSIAAKLEAHRDKMELSRELVTLRDDVEISTKNAKLADLRYKGPIAEADQLFDDLGFHAPLRRLRSLYN